MSSQQPVTSLGFEDSAVMTDLLRRSDLSRMPGRTGVHEVVKEQNLVESMLSDFRQYKISFTATVSEEKRLNSLLITIKDFPDVRCWWVGGLVVDIGARRHGHGSSLIQDLKNRATRSEVLRLDAAAWAFDEIALSFWKSQGFRQSQRLPDWQTGGSAHQRLIVSFLL